MAINVQPIDEVDDEVNDVRLRTAGIVNERILPVEDELQWAGRGYVMDAEEKERRAETARRLRREIRDAVKVSGLWAPHLPREFGGAGLGFLSLAYMYEVLAYAVGASELFGIAAPNSGNAALLAKYGTPGQKERFLVPLVEGAMQSGFSMTEPDTAGSDPRSLRAEATREGDDWVLNGHKWFTSNGIRADFFIVMCRGNDPTGEMGPPGQMMQLIVPTATEGVRIVRGIGVFGHPHSDHCEVVYENVRVPLENTLGRVGEGHQAAQDRLGAGRVYHCMNSIGQMWRAFDLMVERALSREVHGGFLKDKQFVQGFIADSYADLVSARLMTIDAARKVDAGHPEARTAISTIKVAVPAAFSRVVDRAIQVFGGAGVTNDLPLSRMMLGARILRLADGPDEVHRILVAKRVLRHYETGSSWDFGN